MREDGLVRSSHLNYDAIKAATPSAAVLIGGDSAEELYPEVFEGLGGAGIDIIAPHTFGEEDSCDPGQRLHNVRQTLEDSGFALDELRFWTTESGTYNGDPVDDRYRTEDPPFQTERQQASGLIKRFVAPLGVGIERVFWAWGMVEGFGACDCCLFDYTGLIYDGNMPPHADGCDAGDPYDRGPGVKKLAYFSAKQLFKKLATAFRVGEMESTVGARLYRFDRPEGDIWVAWSDDQNGLVTLDLGDAAGSTVRITGGVPLVDYGQDVTNELSAFATEERAVHGGLLELELSTEPIFIEEILP